RGDTIHRWSRRRGPRGRSSGKDRLTGDWPADSPRGSRFRVSWPTGHTERISMFFKFLGRLGHQQRRTAGRRERSRQPRQHLCPRLEALEDRVVPSRTSAVFDPASAMWYLHQQNAAGAPSTPAFRYGGPGWVGVLGDWDGNGSDTVGVFDPATATWYLKNS